MKTAMQYLQEAIEVEISDSSQELEEGYAALEQAHKDGKDVPLEAYQAVESFDSAIETYKRVLNMIDEANAKFDRK